MFHSTFSGRLSFSFYKISCRC